MVMRAGHAPVKKNVVAPRRIFRGDGCRNNSLTCQDKELSHIYAREVAYLEIDGTPGITFRRGCTCHSYEWLPITPTCSPIASRTRTKMINIVCVCVSLCCVSYILRHNRETHIHTQ